MGIKMASMDKHAHKGKNNKQEVQNSTFSKVGAMTVQKLHGKKLHKIRESITDETFIPHPFTTGNTKWQGLVMSTGTSIKNFYRYEKGAPTTQ